MFPYFKPDKARPIHPRPYLIPSIYFTFVVGSFLPPGPFRSIAIISALLYIIYQFPKYSQGTLFEDDLHPIQALLGLLHWIDVFELHSPDEFSRIEDKAPPTTLWDRLKWNIQLCATTRGIGWNWQVKNVPATDPPGMSKWSFVRRESFKVFICYLLFDLTTTIYLAMDPADILTEPAWKQVLSAWLPTMASYYALIMQYSVFAALTVALGLYSCQDWPPLMGKLRDVSSIRGLWGKFWHQLLRRKLNMPYNIFTRYVPIRHGTLTSRYLQLYLAFITSALIHHFGAMNLTTSSAENNWNQLIYFLVQPIGITIEDALIYLGKLAGIKESKTTRILGAFWTFAWFSWSLRYMTAFNHNALIFDKRPMPSLITGITMLLTRDAKAGLHEL